jgi:hypothetical protein
LTRDEDCNLSNEKMESILFEPIPQVLEKEVIATVENI